MTDSPGGSIVRIRVTVPTVMFGEIRGRGEVIVICWSEIFLFLFYIHLCSVVFSAGL